MAKRPKSFYLNISLALIVASFPLFYQAGVANDLALSLLGLGTALVACAVTIAFC